jgi:hypothetical protein
MSGFQAFEIAGSKEQLRGFVDGWAAASRIPPADLAQRVLWADEWDVQLRDRGWLSFLHGPVQGLLVSDELADPFLEALQSHGRGLEPRLRRRVESARFGFEFELFGREEADEVRALFASCGPEVRLENYVLEEKTDPSVAGIELLGSLHDYVFRGSGTAVGLPGPVLALHERTRRHERIHARDITLVLAP